MRPIKHTISGIEESKTARLSRLNQRLNHEQLHQQQRMKNASLQGMLRSGVPSDAPASSLVADIAAGIESLDRPPTAPPKRIREWEDNDDVNPGLLTNAGKRQKLDQPYRQNWPKQPVIINGGGDPNTSASAPNSGYYN